MKKNILLVTFASLFFSGNVLAQGLSGTWQQIDDKTGSPKAIIEIHRSSNNTFTGKVVKITPRLGYTPREKCVNCPSPYTDQPILGLEIFKNLKEKTYTQAVKILICFLIRFRT